MRSKGGAVFLSGLVAGTMDIVAAFTVYGFILHKTTPTQILRSIASAIFRKEAYTGNFLMVFCGLALHYFIAFTFALFYFIIYPYLPFLKKNAALSGTFYGILVWMIMNLIILPIFFPVLPEKHLDFPFLLSVIILILCIGFPIAFITKKYYSFR
ncbi:DUF1440 domain-containing protein [Flavobacterium branchiicola]|uniref:DUF1440 domain-containing protein n=1 Tax=Flavobacterium branchiicola TaxID=1114875 RepID=A0ABV9PMM2_9FLAO|nr:DUF1440 domain-containing protein [Flavobacterium branchiicola]MBS7256557.1 DUF1440 domain-containing protein [Flavobacterium branchiicola]